MSRDLSAQWQQALADLGIRTAYFVRLDLKTTTVRLSTCEIEFNVTGTGDTALDGGTFSPIAEGNIVGLGGNTFSYEGSESFDMTLALSPEASAAIQNTVIDQTEYQARLAYVWRGVQLLAPTESTPGGWGFKRIRSGFIDTLSVSSDRNRESIKITVEAHQAYTSRAAARMYQDQETFWPGDKGTSFMAAIANGDPRSAITAANATAARNALRERWDFR